MPKYFLTICFIIFLVAGFLVMLLPLEAAAYGTSVDFPSSELDPLNVSNITSTGEPYRAISVVIGRIIKALLGVVGAVALLMIVYGGMMMLTAAGSPDKVKKGKDVLTWAIIGSIVVLTSYMMVDYIINAIVEGGPGGSTSGGGGEQSDDPCIKAGKECKDTGCTQTDEAELQLCVFDWAEEYTDDTELACFTNYTPACTQAPQFLCCNKAAGDNNDGEDTGQDCDTDLGGFCTSCEDLSLDPDCSTANIEQGLLDSGYASISCSSKGNHNCPATKTCCVE